VLGFLKAVNYLEKSKICCHAAHEDSINVHAEFLKTDSASIGHSLRKDLDRYQIRAIDRSIAKKLSVRTGK
jgi:hypothetical protein